MPARIITAKAPSNIALIKYMGKKDARLNLPENGSISMTLDALCSLAELEVRPDADRAIAWLPEAPRVGNGRGLSLQIPALGEEGAARICRHVARVRDHLPSIFSRFGLKLADDFSGASIALRTANTFPMASGIASSASAFAAVTLVTAMAGSESLAAFEAAWERDSELRRTLAGVSRQGSGSSCRSFEGPWVHWEEDQTRRLDTRMPEMAHFLLLISGEKKRVSSSAAHAMTKTSPLWEGRPARVARRIQEMSVALSEGQLKPVARIAWTEAWEMHSLFHTAEEPFSYWQPGTLDALHWFATTLTEPRPPIVTLDAGPNIHVMVPASDAGAWLERLQPRFAEIRVLRDRQGAGAAPVTKAHELGTL